MAFVDRYPRSRREKRFDRKKTAEAAFTAGSYLLACYRVAKQRQQLRSLDDRMLGDIGVSRADVHRESTRPFWDLPQNWRELLK